MFQGSTVIEAAAGASKEVDAGSGPSQTTGDYTPPRPLTLEAERADRQLSSEYCKTHLFHWFYASVFPIFITIASLCCFSVLLKTLKPFICLLRTRDLWFKAFHLTLLWFYRAYCTIKQFNRISFCHSPAISSIIWLTDMFNIAFVDLVSVCLLWPELLESLSLRTFSSKHSAARMNHTLEIYTLYLVSNLSVLTLSCVRYLCDPAM